MALELRPYREEEWEAFSRVLSIVFGNFTGDAPRKEDQNILPDWSLCAFEDGQLATTYAAYPMVIRINGGKLPMAGVTAVGSLPWFRRRGHLRKIFEQDLRTRYEQRMQPIAGLLASMAALYQRYGYAVCSTRVRYQIDPRYINFAPSAPKATGTWREASKDELPLLERIYREFAKDRTGYLHRAPIIWNMQVLGIGPNFGGGPPFGQSLLAVYEEAGEPKGYVAYSPKFMEQSQEDQAGPGQRLLVRDYAWLTPGAYRAMWDQLRTFDLVNRVWFPAAPVDDPAPHIMLDPRELHAQHFDHLLCRIIDIERALPLRPYGAEGKFTFAIKDELCPWNEGRWSLEAGGEESRVARSNDSPDLSMDVSTLVQLLFGQISASQALRYGRAEASPSADIDLWDRIWRTKYAPFCPDGF